MPLRQYAAACPVMWIHEAREGGRLHLPDDLRSCRHLGRMVLSTEFTEIVAFTFQFACVRMFSGYFHELNYPAAYSKARNENTCSFTFALMIQGERLASENQESFFGGKYFHVSIGIQIRNLNTVDFFFAFLNFKLRFMFHHLFVLLLN